MPFLSSQPKLSQEELPLQHCQSQDDFHLSRTEEDECYATNKNKSLCVIDILPLES